jgi:peptidoglycan/LPS O-acetylase OafA/YrhL
MLDRLRRITRDGRWIPEIDSLRFIAIFSVLFAHLHGELMQRSGRIVPVEARYAGLSYVLRHGVRGVELFFVISGFILGLPFARQWLQQGRVVSLGKYFLRRLTRLEPPYIVSYLIAIALFGVFTRGAGITRHYLEHVGAGIVYLNNLIFGSSNPVNPVTWSLEIEIQFYILAPVFALLFRIRNAAFRRWLTVFLIAACGAAQILYLPYNSLAQRTILFYAQYFLAGFLLADLYLLHLKVRSAWWDALAVVGWCVYFGVPDSAWAHALFPFLLLLLCAAALCSRALRFFFSSPTIAVIGGMCYSIYLLHFLLIAVVFKVTRYLIFPGDYLASFLIQVVVTALPVVLLCGLYYKWVERVFMDPDWPAKLWKRIRGWRHAPVEALEEQKQES